MNRMQRPVTKFLVTTAFLGMAFGASANEQLDPVPVTLPAMTITGNSPIFSLDPLQEEVEPLSFSSMIQYMSSYIEALSETDRLELIASIKALEDLYENISNGVGTDENRQEFHKLITENQHISKLVTYLKESAITLYDKKRKKGNSPVSFLEGSMAIHAIPVLDNFVSLIEKSSPQQLTTLFLLPAEIGGLQKRAQEDTATPEDIKMGALAQDLSGIAVILKDPEFHLQEFVSSGQINITVDNLKDEYQFLAPIVDQAVNVLFQLLENHEIDPTKVFRVASPTTSDLPPLAAPFPVP